MQDKESRLLTVDELTLIMEKYKGQPLTMALAQIIDDVDQAQDAKSVKARDKEIADELKRLLSTPVARSRDFQEGLTPVSELRELRAKLFNFTKALKQGDLR